MTHNLPVHFVGAIPVVLVLGAAPAASQTAGRPGPTVPHATTTVESLLNSAEPREQAWGAWYVGRDHLRHLTPMLETVVRERIGGATLAEWAAVDIALDALIQLESRVPADLLEDIYPHKPAQALILASQTDDSDDVLTRVLSTAKGHDWFAAANVLLTRRAPALPAALLSSLTLKVTLDLYDREGVGSGRSSGRGGGVGCGGIGLATGLPPWASYSLTSFASPGVTVLAMGPVPVYFKRSVSAPGQTPAPRSVYIDGPTADDRLQYLAGLAGLDRESLPLRGDERHAVVLRSDADLQSRMQLVRADVSQRFARLLRALVAARVMTAEATALYPPHIDLQIEDHRNSR